MTCGACCFSVSPAYVSLSGADHARLSETEQTELTRWIGNRVFMRMDAAHCSALEVDTGDGFPCSIYERRPEPCRALEQGSDACFNDRARVLDGSGTCAKKRAELIAANASRPKAP